MLLKRIKVLSLLFFLVLSSACVSEGSFLGFGTPEISAPELLKQYMEDESKADKKYKGKTIVIEGIIETFSIKESGFSIGLAAYNYSDVLSAITSQFRSVFCYFPSNAVNKLAQLRKGQQVSIRGTCRGLMVNISVDNCTLDEPELNDYFNSEIDTRQVYTVAKILEEYSLNRIAAKLKYTNKRLKVSGKINTLGRDNSGTYVELEPEREKLSIEILDAIDKALTTRMKCYLSNTASRQVMFINTGEQVTISGMCEGTTFSDCSVIEPLIDVPEKILLSSEQLVREFNSDPKIANLKYKGEQFSVSGVIKSFAEARNGICLCISTGNSYESVECYFPQSEAWKIAQLRKGQQIVITGKCNGLSGSNVAFESCVLDEPLVHEADIETEVSSEQILNKAGSNEIAINIQYKGKTLDISGVIGNFSEDSDGICIVLKVAGLTGEINCYMNKEALKQILYLQEGQRIVIRGNCLGQYGSSIKLNNCAVIDPAIEADNEADVLLSPEEILSGVNKSSVKAKIRYQDRQLMIKGDIGSFTKKGNAYGVTLVSSGATGHITCFFSQKELLKVTQLHKRDNITVKGTYSQINSNVIIEACTLEAPDINVNNVKVSDELSVSEILSEISVNEIAVDIKYGRKQVQVSGIVEDIVCDDDKYYLTLSDENFSGNIKCYIQDETVRKVILYGKGDSISLSGICNGYIDGEIIFTKCLIASQIPHGGNASLNTLDSENIDILNTLQDTHADYCKQIFQRNMMTRSRADIKACLSVLNRFLTIWPKNLRNGGGNEVKEASDYLKAIQNGVSGTLIIVEGDFSKEDGWTDTPDMKISFVVNGESYATSIVQDQTHPKFNEWFTLTWTVDIGTISFTGIEVDALFDDVVFSSSVDASGFKGYERLSGTLYNNGNSLRIRFSPSQSIPVCPW